MKDPALDYRAVYAVSLNQHEYFKSIFSTIELLILSRGLEYRKVNWY